MEGNAIKGNGTSKDLERAAEIASEPVLAVWRFSETAITNINAPQYEILGTPCCWCCIPCILMQGRQMAKELHSGCDEALYILTASKLYIQYDREHENWAHKGAVGEGNGYDGTLPKMQSSSVEIKFIGATDLPPEQLCNFPRQDLQKRYEIHSVQDTTHQPGLGCFGLKCVKIGSPTPVVEFAVPTSLGVADYTSLCSKVSDLPGGASRQCIYKGFLMRLYIDDPESAVNMIKEARAAVLGTQVAPAQVSMGTVIGAEA